MRKEGVEPDNKATVTGKQRKTADYCLRYTRGVEVRGLWFLSSDSSVARCSSRLLEN
jgi:hypothetical protein